MKNIPTVFPKRSFINRVNASCKVEGGGLPNVHICKLAEGSLRSPPSRHSEVDFFKKCIYILYYNFDRPWCSAPFRLPVVFKGAYVVSGTRFRAPRARGAREAGFFS